MKSASGPVNEFEKDSRSFYLALLFKQTYQGPK